MKSKRIFSLFVLLTICILLVSCGGQAPASNNIVPANQLEVTYLDVGQGDSIFIRLPDERTMLIDAGEKNNGPMIEDFLHDQEVDRIDFLIATHPHTDHIGGMETIVRSFEIGKIYMPKKSHTSKTYESLLSAIQEKGLKISTAKAGVSILEEPGLSASILAPTKDYDDLNNSSAVIKLVYQDTSFLFTGDAEAESEEQIDGDVRVDVLKIGHHGSQTSTSDFFLQKVSPTYAVISCGEGNSYGHPHPETLKKLNDAGVIVYRTDQLGTIEAISDGTDITFFANGKELES